MSLQDRIESLKAKHAALENAIVAESKRPYPNDVQIHTMKRQKLAIKDELSNISGVPAPH